MTVEIVNELTQHGWDVGIATGAAYFFGPTLHAVRRNVGRWADFHSENMLRLNQRVQDRIDVSEPGGIHPRVAQQVLEQGPWISDDVQQEYLAGLLIASRTASGGSERGAYFARLASALTSQQVRVHRSLCASLAAGVPADVDLDDNVALSSAGVWLPTDVLSQVIEPEEDDVHAEFSEACYALYQHGLIEGFRSIPNARSEGTNSPSPAIGVKMASLGIVLYLWARGVRAKNANDLKGPLPAAPEELTVTPDQFFIRHI